MIAGTPKEVGRLEGKESRGSEPGRVNPLECQAGWVGLGKRNSQQRGWRGMWEWTRWQGSPTSREHHGSAGESDVAKGLTRTRP